MFDDSTIKSKIRIELGVRDIDVDQVDVKVSEGRVTLEGTVDSLDKVDEAEKACMTIEGVISVDNKLELKQ